MRMNSRNCVILFKTIFTRTWIWNCRILLIFFLLLFQYCSEKDPECGGSCTNEYRTITVNVLDNEGNPVALDSLKLVDLKNGEDLTPELTDDALQLMRERGTYPIFSDQYVQEYHQQQLEINFSGFIDGKEVVSENYQVGADCCHVYYVSGDLELELE